MSKQNCTKKKSEQSSGPTTDLAVNILRAVISLAVEGDKEAQHCLDAVCTNLLTFVNKYYSKGTK